MLIQGRGSSGWTWSTFKLSLIRFSHILDVYLEKAITTHGHPEEEEEDPYKLYNQTFVGKFAIKFCQTCKSLHWCLNCQHIWSKEMGCEREIYVREGEGPMSYYRDREEWSLFGKGHYCVRKSWEISIFSRMQELTISYFEFFVKITFFGGIYYNVFKGLTLRKNILFLLWTWKMVYNHILSFYIISLFKAEDRRTSRFIESDI